MVMMVMARDHLIRPRERCEVDELCCTRPAEYPNAALVTCTGPWDRSTAAASEGNFDERFLAFPHDHDVGRKLLQHRHRSGRAVRPDDDEDGSEIANRKCQLLRDPQFGRRATPKQVGGRGGDHRHIGTKGADFGDDVGKREPNKCPSISRTS